ncbi:hypothetical protein ACSR9H_12580 [Citrobacter koseri]|uniref:hypothetical protein n=1 Tax=Citrobacter koseri TaxID=545 RepID=UPI004041B9B8
MYGNPNKDTTIITKNLTTDALTGKNGGNIVYLSFHKYAKNIGGYFQCDPSSTGSPNINKSVFGFYEGGVWDGTYRGPTFGEDIEYGAITGGWISKWCAFSAISTDIRKADGSYPVSRLLVTDGQAIGCNRTLYCQAQDVKFGDIHTTESIATDFLFRINGATPVSVKQIGVFTVYDSVNTPSIFNLAEGARVDLKRSLIFTDLTSITLPFVAGNPSFINDGTYFPVVTADHVVSNLQEKLIVNLSSAAAVTTIRLPASTFSNIRGTRLEVFVYGGDGTKILRITVNNGAGTINGSTSAIDVMPGTGEVRKMDIYGFGSGGAYLLSS